MQIWLGRFPLLCVMRFPLLFLALLGLPAAFGTSMYHSVAELALPQVLSAACPASLVVSTAITRSFMVLLYGHERGRLDGPARAAANRSQARGSSTL
jgi:hypothetical protein